MSFRFNRDALNSDGNILSFEKKENKINIKVKKEDLILLDLISNEIGITRSSLINVLLYEELRNYVYKHDELDTKAYIFMKADETALYDREDRDWVSELGGWDRVQNILFNRSSDQESDEFKLIKRMVND